MERNITLTMINDNREEVSITIIKSEVSYIREININRSEIIMNNGERYIVIGQARSIFKDLYL